MRGRAQPQGAPGRACVVTPSWDVLLPALGVASELLAL